ncbi:hypothetical protein MPSEU_000325300 [Mayamaea pseudoterrestris]|nr:hypothetical protein MPSEU_000325300 [Mayamaea pseudoterrestris]
MSEFHQLPTRDYQPSADWKQLDEQAESRAKTMSPATMPHLNHLCLDDYQDVYEPAADTFLLLDALKHDIDIGCFDHLANSPMIVLEIGSGSGVASVYVRQELLNRRRRHGQGNDESTLSIMSFVTDINRAALEITVRTARANKVMRDDCFETIHCDLAGPLLQRLAGMVHVIIFNPPYVPTSNDEVNTNGIAASWAGGVDGRLVIDRAIPQLARLLHERGCAYLVTVDDNLPCELAQQLARDYQLDCQPLLRKRTRNERLTVLKIVRQQQQQQQQQHDGD